MFVATNTEESPSDPKLGRSPTSDNSTVHFGEDEATSRLIEAPDELNNAHVGLVVGEWAGGTSVHGVALITDETNYRYWYRGLWLIMVLAGSGCMLWQVISLVQQYRRFETTINTDIIVPDTMEFPEVTLCTMSPFSSGLMNQTGISEPANEQELLQISITDYSLVLEAWFGGVYINRSDYSDYLRPVITTFGRCWSFHVTEEIVRPGIRGGFRFHVFLDQSDYPPSQTLVGLMVFAEQPGTSITDQLLFTVISPGMHSEIGLSRTEWGREKKAPWAKCHSAAPEYTQPVCRGICSGDALRKQCKCRDMGDNREPLETKYCQPYSVDKNCLENFNETDAIINCPDDCSVPPCEQVNYYMEKREIKFADNFMESIDNQFGEGTIESVGTVHMNYNRIQYEELTESESITLSTLLGSIGGSMGLFLGISALSVFEIFGDLISMRLIPRLFGYRNLFGLGGRTVPVEIV